MSLDFSSMRHRVGEEYLRTRTETGHDWTDVTNGPPATGPITVLAEVKSVHMYDVVVKDFHRRSNAGEIFNNPMHKTDITYFTEGSYVGSHSSTNNKDGKVNYTKSVGKPVSISLDDARSKRTLHAPLSRLENLALTSAYAGISANTQNAVLWAGEARETVKMATDIGAGLLALYKRTEKQRRAWAKGKLTIPEAQNLTLSILYGILPLEQSIAQVSEGLFKLKPNGRETSRGFQVYTDTNSETVNPSSGEWDTFNRVHVLNETLEVSVRAGVLYDIDVSAFPSIAIIADPKQVIETAYALARLSFVIDWFINVGNTLKAWSPSFGTKELAAWISVKEVYTQQFSRTLTWRDIDYGTSTDAGNVTFQASNNLRIETDTRIPVNRSDLAIFPRVDINLNMDKLFALILLFARVKQV